MSIRRLRFHIRRTVIVTFAIAAITAACGFGGYVSAKTSQPQTCPHGDTCTVIITDIGHGLGAPFEVRDYLKNPMAWVDIFQLGSTNPVCAASIKTATTGYDQCMAALGGPPFNATGGHPILALWDGKKWQILTPAKIQGLNRLLQMMPALSRLLQRKRV
jgi:hypothetical protein